MPSLVGSEMCIRDSVVVRCRGPTLLCDEWAPRLMARVFCACAWVLTLMRVRVVVLSYNPRVVNRRAPPFTAENSSILPGFQVCPSVAGNTNSWPFFIGKKLGGPPVATVVPVRTTNPCRISNLHRSKGDWFVSEHRAECTLSVIVPQRALSALPSPILLRLVCLSFNR